MSYTVRFKLLRDEQQVSRAMLRGGLDPSKIAKQLLIDWYIQQVEKAKKMQAERHTAEKTAQVNAETGGTEDGNSKEDQSVVTVAPSELPAVPSGGAAE